MKQKTNQLTRAAMTLLLVMLCSIGVRAEDAKIIIWLNDGNKSEVLFADMPELTYADGYILPGDHEGTQRGRYPR